MNAYMLELETVKKITGAATDELAAAQIQAVQELLQGYLGVRFIKGDIVGELITVPYVDTTIIQPAYGPINSVSALEILNTDGTYTEYKGAYTTSKRTVQLLDGCLRAFWYGWRKRGQVGRFRLSYNAGLWDNYSAIPALLGVAAEGLLKWLYTDQFALGGYQSEHLGDYSYTKGSTVRGIPAAIAGILDGVKL